ncbi:MAG TPA: hypothetical protein VG388_08005, partial [Solirubrobacteraceae bacterium]|nr:hypothetical protein [Solirubrobacteraceae bacterium]
SRATVTTGRAGRPDRRHAAWARTSAGERRAAVRGPDANAVPIPGPLDERSGVVLAAASVRSLATARLAVQGCFTAAS